MDELKLIEYKPQKKKGRMFLLVLGILILFSIIVFSKNKPLLEGGFEEIRVNVFGVVDDSGEELEPVVSDKIDIFYKNFGKW